MTRASVYVVVLLVAFNAGAVMLSTTGVDRQVGIGADVDNNATDNITEAAGAQNVGDDGGGGDGSIIPGSGSGGIIGLELFQFLADALSSVFQIQPAMQMLADVGVPGYLITWMNSIIAIIVAFDILRFVKGGGL